MCGHDETEYAPPSLLELELTESALIEDAEQVLATLIRIKKLGVRLAIDDFGTGYSSFAYLRRFQVDTLKIDQSFVRDLLSDPDAAAIVRAIIQMSRRLGLHTLAEGVETAEIGNALQLIDCRFWFALIGLKRPEPVRNSNFCGSVAIKSFR